MANGYTIFSSYVLVPTSGFSQAIHCNYIRLLPLNTNNPTIEEVSLRFLNVNDFKFLNHGYSANKIYMLVQLVSGITSGNTIIKPNAANWKIVEVTNQIVGYVSGHTLTPANLVNTVFKVPLFGYTGFTSYNLSYLDYPTKFSFDDNKLCFGDEIYFLGNVTTDIHADVFTTDPQIELKQKEFNSSTNATWDGTAVAITEIGIYDANKNLVAIGKLNDPLVKDFSISRTLVFNIDF
jgi:hypothetical protein